MPILGQVVPQKKQRERIEATNKQEIPNGTRKAEIVDVWVYNVDADGRYTAEKTGELKVSLKIRFDKRPDIVLDKRMRCYISKKARFALLIQSLTGIQSGSDEMKAFDTDDLIGMKVLVTTEYKEPYTNVTDIIPRETDEDVIPAPPPVATKPAPKAVETNPFDEDLDDEIPF
jgi:hypothetical protein